MHEFFFSVSTIHFSNGRLLVSKLPYGGAHRGSGGLCVHMAVCASLRAGQGENSCLLKCAT